jgi:hypothetical protein
MPYGTDVSVYVEDKQGDLGAPGSPAPWWLSPDVDIPAHSGLAGQGTNQVQVRVHSHEEPIVEEKIVAEVYVGMPGFVLSPVVGTKRIDPGNLKWRPPTVPGTEPIADETGSTLSFPWTPSAVATEVDGPGHRCLIVRAFPESVTPPTDPFIVPDEGHEAQHNIEVITTTMAIAPMPKGGAGIPGDPRHRDEGTGLWWEIFSTMAAKRPGKHYVAWAFDPEPNKVVVGGVRKALKEAGITGFSQRPPGKVTLEVVKAHGGEIDPQKLCDDQKFAAASGIGSGLFDAGRLVGAASLELEPNRLARLLMRFDLSDLDERTAAVLHGVQWNEAGEAEGGMTVIALAPTDP